MTIHKAKNFIEVYRARARARDINELSGRTGRPDLTRFVAEQIAATIALSPDTVLVDVGCGCGMLLQQVIARGVDSYQGRIIGILPTKEEVIRVRNHLLDQDEYARHLISIEHRAVQQTNFPDNFADVVICNGVLHLLGDREAVSASLRELRRILKKGGKLFCGEIPACNEVENRTYGDSISLWLVHVLKHQGFQPFLRQLKRTLVALFSREPFVIKPKRIFHMPEQEFLGVLREQGFEVLDHYRHKEKGLDGEVRESRTRWDYVAVTT